jgi:hypothetical protein
VHEALGPAQFPASEKDRRLASPVGVDERFAERSSQLDHLFVCCNERRAQLERVASQCADDVAAFDEVIGDCGRIEVGAQADASEEAGDSSVLNCVEVVERVEFVVQRELQLLRAFEEVFFLENVEVGFRHGARGRMARIGDAVSEGQLALRRKVRLPHRGCDEDAAEWRIPGRDTFREGDEVGLQAVPLGREHSASATKTGNHLIGDAENVIVAADPFQPFKISGRWRIHAAGALDGFGYQCGDIFGARFRR